MKKSEIDKKSREYKEGTRLIVVLCIVGLLFVALCANLTIIELFTKDKFINNAFNQRQWKQEQDTLRGNITDRDGVVLAESKMQDDTQKRVYNFGAVYTHIIGYNSKTYGKSQIELAYNKNLAGLTELSGLTELAGQLQGEKRGDTVQLTVSDKLQQKAYNMLGNRRGAVVAIDPRTGEVLCMVSKPTFTPDSDSLHKNWENLSVSEKSPFVPRATSGLYAPGSVFKTVIAAAAYENGLEDTVFVDKGEIVIDGKTFENQNDKAYGEIDIKEAYSVSSNIAFIELGQTLGEEKVREYIGKFGIGNDFGNFELPYEKSRFVYDGKMSQTELASVSIGQGKLLVTPLQMALVAGAVANDGIMQSPYIVKKVTNSSGIPVEGGKSKILGRAMSPSAAEFVTECMVETVKNGTGRNAAVYGIDVAGKTGTAENEVKGKEHTWFIGFAPADDPEIAVAVVLEYSGGSGGGNAAPIAAELFRTWINN